MQQEKDEDELKRKTIRVKVLKGQTRSSSGRVHKTRKLGEAMWRVQVVSLGPKEV